MKTYIRISFIYAVAALASGVFYREFTKWMDFTGKTTLSITHTHLFVLGTLLFLIIALFNAVSTLTEQKRFKQFMVLYNIGLPFMIIMFYVRGITQVLNIEFSPATNAAISGIAGISHLLVGISIIFLFLALRCSNQISSQHNKEEYL